MKIKWT